jgi:hypothetical protein
VARATRQRIARGLVLALASALVADQLVQWTVLRDGSLLGRRIAPYDPPLFTPEQGAKLEQIRARGMQPEADGTLLAFDAELGWCSRPESSAEGYSFDWAGARIGAAPLAREPAPDRTRVVALGDSFTFGLEVGARETWIAVLERARPELEIANLGVCGYDLVQSLLRWRRDGAPLGPREVWIGFVPSQVLRNVTVYMPAWRHWTPILAFKPRAELAADGTPRCAPCPVRSLAELAEVLADQERFLQAVGDHDRWVRAWPAAYARSGSSLLHFSAGARLVLTALEHGGREPAAELERPGSETVELFSAQLRELATSGVRLRILVLPDRDDLAWLRGHGVGYWRGLCQRLERDGLEVFDASAGLLAAGADLEPQCWAPGRHYSARANEIVARLLEAHLAERR